MICLPMKHVEVLMNLFLKLVWQCFPDRIGIWKCRFWEEEKNLMEQKREPTTKQQTQLPTYGVNTRIRNAVHVHAENVCLIAIDHCNNNILVSFSTR